MGRILIVDNHDSFVYNLVGLLRQEGESEFEIMKNDEIDFSALVEFDRIILSPGPGVPTQAGDLNRLLERTYKSHSILGVCLGLQAIVEFFGGEISQMPYPKHGHKSELKIIDKKDLLLKDIPEPSFVARYHSWVCSDVGNELICSSLDEQGNVMSVYHPSYKIHSVQFHPESIISNCGKKMIRNWLVI